MAILASIVSDATIPEADGPATRLTVQLEPWHTCCLQIGAILTNG